MQPSTKIAVAGATGRVGRPVVDRNSLESRGYEVVPIARSLGVDVITGEGLDEALTVRSTRSSTPRRHRALARPAGRDGVLHDLHPATCSRPVNGRACGGWFLVSIIGIEKFAGGYNAAKVAHEQAALAGPIPARIVRAAQFHEFVEELMRWGTDGDVSYVWGMRTQLVSARSGREGSWSTWPPPRTPSSTRPRPRRSPARARSGSWRRHDSWPRVAARPRGSRSGATRSDPDSERYANGAVLPGPGAKLAGPTFEEWLDGAMVR